MSKNTTTRTASDTATGNPANETFVHDEDDGIDYEPALAAVDDLASWAFDLAGKDVAEWPEGKRRVRNARRYVHAVLRGKRVPKQPHGDLMFTAALLARILDAEVGIGLDRIGEILGELALPVDHAPVGVRRAPEADRSRPIAPSAWRHVRSIYQTLPVSDAEEARHVVMTLSAAERDAWIAVLTQLSVEEGALVVLAYLRGAIPAPFGRAA